MDELDSNVANRATRRGFLKRGLASLAGAFAIGPLTASELFRKPGQNGRFEVLDAVAVATPDELAEPVAAARVALAARGFEVPEGQAVRVRVASPDGVDEIIVYQAATKKRGGEQAHIVGVVSNDVGPTFEVQAGISNWRGDDLRGIEYWRWADYAMVHSAKVALTPNGTVSWDRSEEAALSRAEMETLVKGFQKTRDRIQDPTPCCSCIIHEVNEGGVTCGIATFYLCALLSVICGPLFWACDVVCFVITTYACANVMSCWDACRVCYSTGQCTTGVECDICCS